MMCSCVCGRSIGGSRDNKRAVRRGAAEMTQTFKPNDPEKGLDKDISNDSFTRGLREMAYRGFATIRAKGRTASGRKRNFDQGAKVKREKVKMPQTYPEAERRVVDYGLGLPAPGSDEQNG